MLKLSNKPHSPSANYVVNKRYMYNEPINKNQIYGFKNHVKKPFHSLVIMKDILIMNYIVISYRDR